MWFYSVIKYPRWCPVLYSRSYVSVRPSGRLGSSEPASTIAEPEDHSVGFRESEHAAIWTVAEAVPARI